MKKFKVLAGSHVCENGVTYKKGDVVQSYEQLDTLFVNKFQFIGEVEESQPFTPFALASTAKTEDGTESDPSEGSDEDETEDTGTDVEEDTDPEFQAVKRVTGKTGKYKKSKKSKA